MLFIIPGFPFITSGIDMAKQDMRSGFERLAYAIMIVVVATLTAWLMALLLRLQPMDFLPLGLPVWARIFCCGWPRLFLRRVRLLADVQQPGEARIRRCRDRRAVEHAAA